MPRRRRIVCPGEIHHVISRSIDGIEIFTNDLERSKFISSLGTLITKTDCMCYAWSIMPNHYHLVLRPLGDSLSTLMRRLNGSYARYFNRRHNRRGYLFQDRFKSIATQRHDYLCELIRYVHLNPIRAGLVKTLKMLETYRWCGHGAMMGCQNVPWQSVNEALWRFANQKKKAREAYVKFLKAGLMDSSQHKDSLISLLQKSKFGSDNAVPDADDRLIGDADFIRKAIAKAEYDIRSHAKYRTARPTLKAISQQIGKKMHIDPHEIFSKGRNNKRAEFRVRFFKQAVRKYGYKACEIAAFLGITPGAVSKTIYAKENT